jgi:hypothetical protein
MFEGERWPYAGLGGDECSVTSSRLPGVYLSAVLSGSARLGCWLLPKSLGWKPGQWSQLLLLSPVQEEVREKAVPNSSLPGLHF